MSTTKAIRNVVATPTTVEVPFLDRSNWEEIPPIMDNVPANSRVKAWQRTSGDEDYPLTLQIAVHQNPGKNSGLGEVVITTKLMTFATEVDDTTGELVWEGPVKASITTTVPGRSGVVDSDDYMSLVSNLYTAFFAGVDGSNIPLTTVVDKLKFNAPAFS